MKSNNKATRQYMGVDVSMEELVGGYFGGGAWNRHKVENKIDSIDRWLLGLDKSAFHFVLEHTGVYSDRLIHCLSKGGCLFSVVNPAQSSAMSKVLRKSNKTDDQDAQTLSKMGEQLELVPYKMPDEMQQKRKEAFNALSGLQKQERQLKNQLHALGFKVSPSAVVVQNLQKVLDSVQVAIAELEKELKEDLKEEEEQKIIRRIKTIPGVGLVTARAMVAFFGDFSQFTSAKAFAKFIGICPSEFRSGKSVRGKSKITRMGNAKIRGLLFNCARSAIRYNQHCKEHFNNLIEKGKKGNVALTAEMHKIARLIFGVVRSGNDYDPNFAISTQIIP